MKRTYFKRKGILLFVTLFIYGCGGSTSDTDFSNEAPAQSSSVEQIVDTHETESSVVESADEVVVDSEAGDVASPEEPVVSEDISSVFPVDEGYIEGYIYGFLVDSPVRGAQYHCGELEGKTNSSGRFYCETLPVSFSVGNVLLGSVNVLKTDAKIFPQELLMLPRGGTFHPEVTKMAVFLQSLDSDGSPLNGITITQETIDAVNRVMHEQRLLSDIPLDEFQSTIEQIVTLSPDSGMRVVSSAEAQDNLTVSVAGVSPQQ